jgi:hypothetical protein
MSKAQLYNDFYGFSISLCEIENIHKHDLKGLNFLKKFNPQINLHPDKSLKNTGFKDSATANHTINLISKRSLRYQFDVINTMYNRAKYHPHSNDDMKKAMVVF